MARDFSGTNQSAENENGVSNIDVAGFTMSCVFNADVADDGGMFNSAAAITAGTGGFAIHTFGSGGNVRWRVFAGWTGFGQWRDNTNRSTGTWYYVAVTYNRSDVNNNPVMYADGTLISETEINTPSGTAQTGIDSVIMGENEANGDDYNGQLAECAFWSRELSAGELISLTGSKLSPLFFPSGLEGYWPLVRDLNDRMQGANLTNTGSTVAAHPSIIYPSISYIIARPVAAGIDFSAIDQLRQSGGMIGAQWL